MTRSELIERIASLHPHMQLKDVADGVKGIINLMVDTLAEGRRIEIRGFGSFELRHRKARRARNPKNGDPLMLGSKYVPHYKPGKELRERVTNATVPIQSLDEPDEGDLT